MATRTLSQPVRRVSLTVRISILLIAAVVLPLLITIIGSELILRPTLMTQATTEMQNDAQSHAQAIDALLIARLQDLKVLGQYYAIQQFLNGDQLYRQQARDELALGQRMDANYSDWTLFDKAGKQVLSYPAYSGGRGKYTIPPAIMTQLQEPRQTAISDVYFNANLHMAYIDIYTSIASPQGKVIGIGRSTLLLTDIWTAVNNETNAATGSYAMILDTHGVRIAYTNTDTTLITMPTELFKATSQLSAAFQQQIKDEDIYGNSKLAVSSMADSTLANQQQDQQAPASFQFTPERQKEAFQAYQARTQVIPWSYIVLRPVDTITGAATQQDIYLLLLALIITILAAIVGLIIGRRTTGPILHSVSLLTTSSEALKKLSTREQARAKEQKWIVESAETGLKSVQYYAKASSIAAQKLEDIGQGLVQNWEKPDTTKRQRSLQELISTSNYVKKAAGYQERSSKGLSTAIQVTNQVAEQLLAGAASASEAADQLEEVITQLRQVVGN